MTSTVLFRNTTSALRSRSGWATIELAVASVAERVIGLGPGRSPLYTAEVGRSPEPCHRPLWDLDAIFWLGLMLIALFAVRGWLPVRGGRDAHVPRRRTHSSSSSPPRRRSGGVRVSAAPLILPAVTMASTQRNRRALHALGDARGAELDTSGRLAQRGARTCRRVRARAAQRHAAGSPSSLQFGNFPAVPRSRNGLFMAGARKLLIDAILLVITRRSKRACSSGVTYVIVNLAWTLRTREWIRESLS